MMDLLGKGRTRAEFERFVASHGDRLLRTAYLITWDLVEAEDLVQECLLRVARRWPRVQAMSRPDAYARRILVNLALDGAQRRTRLKSELTGQDGLLLESPAQARSLDGPAELDDRSELLEALGALPQRQRLVLVLRYFADLSEAQTAEALDCSLGTVKSTTSRGLVRLREAMVAAATGHDTDRPPPDEDAQALSPTHPDKEKHHD